MSTLRDRGIAAHIRRKKQAAGVSAAYTRGATTQPLTPWVGNTDAVRNMTDPGQAVTFGDRDYLMAVADLQTIKMFPPQRGDRITETINGAEAVFEIVVPNDSEPAWRYSDQTRQIVRCHTKRVT